MAKVLDTVYVKAKNKIGFRIINKSDFDSKQHERITEKEVERLRAARANGGQPPQESKGQDQEKKDKGQE